MEIGEILLGGVIAIITSIVTAYVTTRSGLRQERVKWERELAQKLAELKSNDPPQANNLTRQFAVAYLLFEQPETSQREKVFIPPVGKISVGRGPHNDVNLVDGGISRTHAVFAVKDGVVFVQDMGTINGVFLNGTRVQLVEKLQDGDTIQMGNTHITFHKL